MMNICLPAQLNNKKHSYQELSKIKEGLETETHVSLDFKRASFIQPNILAILALFIFQAKKKAHKVVCSNVSSRMIEFLRYYQFVSGEKEKKPHFISLFKFTRRELLLFEKALSLELGVLSDELNRYITNRLAILFSLASNEGTHIFCSGYCNMSRDWLCVTLAYDEVLFNDFSALEEAVKSGQIRNESRVDFLMLIDEIILQHGKVWIGSEHFVYSHHEQSKLIVPHNLDCTFITVHIPIYLMQTEDKQ